MEAIEKKKDFLVVDKDENDGNNSTRSTSQQQRPRGVGGDLDSAIDDTIIVHNNNDNLLPENDIYYDNCINLSLLDPSRYGWMAIGGIADLSTPHERDRRKTRRSQTSSSTRRVSNKRNRNETVSQSRRNSIKNGTMSNQGQAFANGKNPVNYNTATCRKKITTNTDTDASKWHTSNCKVTAASDSINHNATTTTSNMTSINPSETIPDVKRCPIDNPLESSISSINDNTSDNNLLLGDLDQNIDVKVCMDNNKKDFYIESMSQHATNSDMIADESNAGDIASTKPSSNDTIDILAYHLGREKFDLRNAARSSNDIKPMIATITVDIPLSNPSENLSESGDFFRETIQWDLSDTTMPNPIIVATQIGEQFGLTYPMIWDLAHSIQVQLRNYVNDNCTYTSPTFDDPESVELGHDNQKAITTVPQLYGEITGFTQVGGTCTLPITRRKAPPTSNTTTQRVEPLTSVGRSLSGSQRSISNSSSRQHANNVNKARTKVEPVMAVKSRRVVPKLPISEFPKEVIQGMDLDFGYDVDYRTLFKAEGSFLVTNDTQISKEVSADTSSTIDRTSATPQRALQPTPHMDDGSVDFCNVCKNVGNLLCCDFCPRAFHTQCVSSNATPETMNDESKWECPSCIVERNGLPGDYITETPMFDKLVNVYHVDVEDASLLQHVTVLSILHEMLRTLMNYDFGNVFRSPVNCKEISTYKTIVKNPMDLGTISKNLEKGHYKCKSLESVVLAILKDIELVWHNCFIFNVEGSAVYRMAKIHKQRAFSTRQSSFDHMISDRVKNDLADYVSTLELERDNHRRLDALTMKSRQSTTLTPSSQSRHKITGTFKSNAKGRAVAILDAESGRIMKVYSTMQAATNAVNFIFNLKRHECEWDETEIDTLNKMRKIILNGHSNPNLRLFGYRWLGLDELRKRRVKFANPKSTILQDVEDEKLSVPEETVKEELVELVSDGKSFIFYSIDEALSFPLLPDNTADLRKRLEALVCGTEFESIDGNMWKRSDLDDLGSSGIEYVKEDTMCGDTVILCGFVDILAAHKDWSQTLHASIASNEDVHSLEFFSRVYLDQDRTVDGIRWRWLKSRSTEVDDSNCKSFAQTKSSCDGTINTSASVSGIRQETSSTDTHSTNNSSISHVYDLETVPSPKRLSSSPPRKASPIKRNGFNELESHIPNITLPFE